MAVVTKYANELAVAAALWNHYQTIADEHEKTRDEMDARRREAQAQADIAQKALLELARKAELVPA